MYVTFCILKYGLLITIYEGNNPSPLQLHNNNAWVGAAADRKAIRNSRIDSDTTALQHRNNYKGPWSGRVHLYCPTWKMCTSKDSELPFMKVARPM